jgi:predicted dithiol-disulfide oxidoreductase (DUF899 family)
MTEESTTDRHPVGSPSSSPPASIDLPQVVDAANWRAARLELLAKEKQLNRYRDAVNAARRELPMVEVDKPYVFDGPDGPVGLADLFRERRQLLIYHFMFEPDWTEGCPSCSYVIDNVGHQAHLHARGTTLAVVSRAPLDRLEAYRKRMGWDVDWYSSGRSDFNLDFGVTFDASSGHVEYNYRDMSGDPAWQGWTGEQPGVSAFLTDGGRIFHTYSTYGRGTDLLVGTYNWLDLTALGRQEDWERPPGRSDSPAMSWLHRHDQYPTGT